MIMMSPWTPERKTQAVLRAAGVAVLLLGAYISSFAFNSGYVTIMAMIQRRWLESSFAFGNFAFALPFMIFFIYVGWRNAYRPETANPRFFLLSLSFAMYFVSYHFAHQWLPDPRWPDPAWAQAHLLQELCEFGILLFCSMLYYACCRWMQRLAGLTETQRAALARRPSSLISFLLCVQCLGMQGSLVYYLQKKNSSYDVGLMAFIGVPLTIILFVYIHRRLTRYLTLAGLNAPSLQSGNEAPPMYEV